MTEQKDQYRGVHKTKTPKDKLGKGNKAAVDNMVESSIGEVEAVESAG